MGLDIVVYKREVTIPSEIPRGSVCRDESTGEVYALPPAPDLDRELTIAAEARLGNLAEVAHLRSALNEPGRPTPTLLAILGHASAAGAVFATEAAHSVLEEIRAIRGATGAHPALDSLCDSLEQIAHAAIREGNPMVLV